jgi:hypothetical protein
MTTSALHRAEVKDTSPSRSKATEFFKVSDDQRAALAALWKEESNYSAYFRKLKLK